MQRFVLRENIVRFEKYLEVEPEGRRRASVCQMLRAAQQELALLEAAAIGVQVGLRPLRLATSHKALFHSELERSKHPCLLLDPRAGLHIVGINAAYAAATMTTAASICGRSMFDVFPDNPDDPTANGVANLFESLRAAAETGRAHAMAIQRYDVRDPDGCFVERYWRPVNTPLLDEDGTLIYLLHKVEDVTSAVKAAARFDVEPIPG